MTGDGYWNYRVMRHEKDGETWVSIHEVYYDKKNKPIAFTVEAIDVVADDMGGMEANLQHMIEALDKRVLTPGDFSDMIKEEAKSERQFKLGDRVAKKSGSSWHGRIVGFYSTDLTPIGYCVESERETGSVQLYPEAALIAYPKDE